MPLPNFSRYWAFGLFVCSVLTAGSWIKAHRSTQPSRPERTGWEDLLLCGETSSLAGGERLNLSADGRVEMRKILEDGGFSSERPLDGMWRLDDASGRYQIELDGRTTAYNLVRPRDSHTCMLIAGELRSADLNASWFSVFEDPDYDPWDRIPHER